jgi:hypothetical protein
VPDLIDHLHARGLKFRAVSPSNRAPTTIGAYVTTGKHTWEQLSCLPADARQAALWEGVVFCQRVSEPDRLDFHLAAWGDGGWRAGPFVFHGDRRLLDRIREALAEAGED